MGSNANVSVTNPTASLVVDGPINGRTKYAPWPTPQYPSVWPKSSFLLSPPFIEWTSIKPKRPMVLFTITLPVSLAAYLILPCNNSFITVTTSLILLKKLLIPYTTNVGAIFLYPFETGLIIAPSATSLNL